ncbi:MAG: alpha-L-fucosidase [Planctomycetes bacterium]|nr:alpha-L-fucosidase [Planctomycetota bacterium]
MTQESVSAADAFLGWKFGMMLSFNMSTFHDMTWTNGYEDPATFAPDKLDCGQWADAATKAGMKYGVLTVKHTGGWCLWDSQYTSHDATAFINYKDGKGDIVREYAESFRERDLKVGFYYCFPGDFSGKLGNVLPEGARDLHGMPPEAEGNYAGFIKKQLTELLTQYGSVDLMWIDQYANRYTGEQWKTLKGHIKSLQPNCLVIGNNSIDGQETDVHSYEYPWLKPNAPERALPPEDNDVPAEVCDKMGPGWFWKSWEDETNLMEAEEVVRMLRLCNSRMANYLLDVAPDKSGLIPDHSVQRLEEVGELRSGP